MSKSYINPSFTREEFLEAVIHHDICITQEIFKENSLNKKEEEKYFFIQETLHELFFKSIAIKDWDFFIIKKWQNEIILNFIAEVENNKMRVNLFFNLNISKN